MPQRQDFAERIKGWIAGKNTRGGESLFKVANRKTAEMIRRDLLAARNAWIEEGSDEADKQRRLASSFLAYKDDRGYVVDFHSLRKTFITNLSRAGVSPKAAQALARHSDINLTMNTYTMLGVLDQAAAVESLPPVPQADETTNRAGAISRASGTDGRTNGLNGATKRCPQWCRHWCRTARIADVPDRTKLHRNAPGVTRGGLPNQREKPRRKWPNS